MRTHVRHALIVAGWEYQRCFRWKHLLLGVFVFSAAMLVMDRPLVAGVVIVVTMMALAIAMLCMASGIRREKRERVAESLAAAMTPYAWIDGKLLGTALYALTCVLVPAAAVPRAIPALLAWTTLALLLWSPFCAAVAAAFDQASYLARRLVLLAPLLLAAPSAAVIAAPDGRLAKLLSLFPLTSAPAMPARMLLTQVPPGEVMASVLLLTGAILLMRWFCVRLYERTIIS